MPSISRHSLVVSVSSLVLLSACVTSRPPHDLTSSFVGVPQKPDEWQAAQSDIASLDPPADGDPYAVSSRQFVIDTETAPFYCGEYGIHAVLLVYGCFRAEPVDGGSLGVIRYVPGREALRHEARHAILFALGDPRWPDVGH